MTQAAIVPAQPPLAAEMLAEGGFANAAATLPKHRPLPRLPYP
ncbi:MAG: hypothetical protein ACO3JG_13475 [Luteolibacter sp.]